MTIRFNEHIIALRLAFAPGNESYLSGSFRSQAENHLEPNEIDSGMNFHIIFTPDLGYILRPS